MSKCVLQCVCKECKQMFELEADWIVPGMEGWFDIPQGRISVLDPSRTDRRCPACVSILLEKLVKEATDE